MRTIVSGCTVLRAAFSCQRTHGCTGEVIAHPIGSGSPRIASIPVFARHAVSDFCSISGSKNCPLRRMISVTASSWVHSRL